MLKFVLSISLLFSAQLALAAIPPMSEEMRQFQATHIVEGKVLRVEKELVNARGENQEFKDWHFTAEIEISKFIKADAHPGIDAETLIVTFWKPAKRPRGWSGPQGQNGMMAIGDQVRLYMTKNAEVDVYHLLTPNGWELLNSAAVSYLDAMDDIDWFDDANESDGAESDDILGEV